MNKTAEMMVATHKLHAEPVESIATNCRHEWIDDGMFTLVCVHCEAEERHDPEDGMPASSEQKCETCHDQGEVFVSKGKVEYGMLTEPEPIYKPCPDCAEPANKERAQ